MAHKLLTPEEVHTTYGVKLSTALAALDKLRRREVTLLTVSGRIGAGKDTVAPLIMELIGRTDTFHESFARALKEEVDQVIQCILEAPDRATAVRLVGARLTPNHIEPVVEAIFAEVKSGEVKSAYDRTAGMRKALQWWGTEVRRSEDTDYWVKRAMAASLEKVAGGTSVYLTDSRFPNEADSVLLLGGDLVRLEVSPEEQRRRILNRDGIEPSAEAMAHRSETALDDYPFPLSILTDGHTQHEVARLAVEGLGY